MSAVDHAVLATSPEALARPSKPRRGLFAKYTLSLVSLVVFVLAINGVVETWIIYGETMTRVQHAQSQRAEAVAKRVADVLADVERQVSWATRASSMTLERRQADYEVLLADVPSIVEMTFVDGDGKIGLDVMRPDAPHVQREADPTLLEALNHQVWFGPTTFVGAEPFMILAVAHAGANAGSTVARIALRGLGSVLGPDPLVKGSARLVDASGRIVAAPDAEAAQVGQRVAGYGAIASTSGVMVSDAAGRPVIASGAPVAEAGWTVVVAQPMLEALRPVVDLLIRLAWLLALGLAVAVMAGLFLARRLTRPIQALHQGAAAFAANRFDHRITVRTRDELEELSGQLNRMAGELGASYGQLELKVEQRTRDLERSVRDLEALEEIGRAVASSLDLTTVLSVIVTRAVLLTKADAGAIFVHDALSQSFRLAESNGLPAALVEAAGAKPVEAGTDWSEAGFGADGLIRIPDLERDSRFPLRQAILDAGFRSILVAALQGADQKLGVLVLFRRAVGEVLTGRVGTIKTLTDQSVLAMHNALLFKEVADKGSEIEVANAHRSVFFANMSHELRTPLNAVLGYSELLSDGIYGEISPRALGILERIQTNGKHLLNLINDVLDLTKMEAGALSLSLNSYSMQDLVASVLAAAGPLAAAKDLALTSTVPAGLPLAHGDDRRLMQVLLNLVGNAIKFTQEGSVTIEVSTTRGTFHVVVRDTGPGIPAADLQKIFEEFHQVQGVVGQKTTGTGLGLSISRRLVRMHGGTIEVASNPGKGSAFTIVLPVRVEKEQPSA